MKKAILGTLLLIIFSVALAQTPDEKKAQVEERLNLSFEFTADGQPANWAGSKLTRPYRVTSSNAEAHQGAQSVAFQCATDACEDEQSFGVVTQRIPATSLAGKTLRYTGYLKTEEVEAGYMGLLLRVDGEVGRACTVGRPDVLAFDIMPDKGVAGTNNWREVEIILELPQNAQEIYFGALLTGKGRAWLDGLSLTVLDSDTQRETSVANLLSIEELTQETYELPADLLSVREVEEVFEPPAELLDWLCENVVPLETATPIDYDQDLTPLKEMIGEARVVALGEATHGTSEFFTLKHRIVQFLAEEMDFTVFSIEANMPEAYRLNEYILTGEGDPKELLRDIHYLWIWNAQEVLDLVLWMREYNTSGRGVMQFTGFDMQIPTVAMEEVRTFVEAYDPAYLAQLDRAYKTVESIFSQGGGWNAAEGELERWRGAAQEVLTHFTDSQTAYSGTNQSELAWAVQNARIVLQAAEYRLARFDQSVQGRFFRDKSMAANVEWILEQNPEAKVVLWAHNIHIQEQYQDEFLLMGERLAEKLGENYFSLGFTFYGGDFQAQPRTGEKPQAYPTENAPSQSVEGVFHTLGLPLFLLDLRAGEQKQASWLAVPRDTRTSIGTIANHYQLSFSKRQLPREYDALIFIDQMTPTHLLK